MPVYTVKTLAGLEDVCAKEIVELGYPNVEVRTRAVQVEAPERFLYEANYRLYTAISILETILAGTLRQPRDLYNQLAAIPWDKYMDQQQTFAFKGHVSSSYFNNSIYAMQLAKDALVDFFRNKFGRRPSVDRDHADHHFVLRVNEEKFELSRDASGAPLFQRGYRQQTGRAPLNEVLAAGIIRNMDWDPSRPLVDPMCGSGTFIIEAARMARRMPAQMHRKQFALFHWPEFQSGLWEEVVNQADAAIIESPDIRLLGADQDGRVVDIARTNAKAAGVEEITQWKQAAFQQLPLPWEEPVLIMNPPYDVRLQHRAIEQFYGEIGTVLKHKFAPCEAWIFSANPEAMKAIGLRPSRKINLYNGQLPAQLRQFVIFAGKRKDQYD
ncbi:MAG: class I SAM-dependent RNA methyltransferase [Saprospiraceae bacterium]|nr:class I SAM-dependent RNA methyltransferase [Saprospiraceae bacterium]MCB9318704.1 class I SAM-dependent RNA methyltransferase [Lewinellaceae bacterium]HPG09748.1 class I SAM-dependent RNA methyltransferase [Saprospiraceae bacterium]